MGIRIEVGKFLVTSDDSCFTLWSEEKIHKAGKHIGEPYRTEIGYYPSFGVVLHQLMDRGVQRSEAVSLKQFKAEFDDLRKEIIKNFKMNGFKNE
jgi:hypothetical protein